MLTGRVRPDGLPVLPVTVGGQVVDGVIDTGFEGAIQLPAPLLATLNPTYVGSQPYQLGDGSPARLDLYKLEIEFAGSNRNVIAVFSDHDEVLIGTDLLKDYRLTIDWPAGTVLLDRPTP